MIKALQVHGLDEDEAMLQVGLVTFVVIAGLVALFLWKNRIGSQGWRVKASAGVHRAFTFMVWLIFKRVPWKPILIWGPWVAMILVASFYGIENWRGKRAGRRTRHWGLGAEEDSGSGQLREAPGGAGRVDGGVWGFAREAVSADNEWSCLLTSSRETNRALAEPGERGAPGSPSLHWRGGRDLRGGGEGAAR